MGQSKRKSAARRATEAALRYPCGKRRPARPHEPAWTPELIARRAEAAGGRDQALDQRAGSALGQLRLRGVITDRQYYAGLELGRLHRAWAAAVGAPPRAIMLPDSCRAGREPDPEEYRRLKQKLDRIWAAVARVEPHPELARSLVDSVVIDDVLPRGLVDGGPLGEKLRGCLARALDAITK